MSRHFRRIKDRAFLWIFIFFICFFLYTEIYTYTKNATDWIQMECNNRQVCTKILLVADPQLIGYQNERFGITPVSVWDSDRYLMKTFHHAFEFAKPDLVIFLGDLFDEGSIATDDEFKLYAKRLFSIFLKGEAGKVKHIWLPGDNDIGGEGRDFVTNNKIKRFNAVFSQPDSIHFRNISFYKINRLIQTIPKLPQKLEFFDSTKIVVGLSHVPLMFAPAPFVEKVLNRMQPHLLLTAHEHKSMIVSTDGLTRENRQIIPITQQTTRYYKAGMGEDNMYEIIAPTCSYRMGTDKMGYGYAIIENNELQYTVLWSPSRFSQLYHYVLGLFVFLLLLLFKLYRSRCAMP